MRIGGVGSRDYKDTSIVQRFVDALPNRGVVLVSGGARGVDAAFAGTAERGKWRGKETEVYKPVVQPGCSKFEYALAAFARNKTIVKRSDVVVAFWDYKSGGTANSLAWAATLGKPAYVVGPHGEGFDEALAAVLTRLNVAQEFDDSYIQRGIEDQNMGRMMRAMPCNWKIHRLPYYNKGKEWSEYTVYNTTGDVVAFSKDPHAAFVSAFGRFTKGEKVDCNAAATADINAAPPGAPVAHGPGGDS